MQVNKYIFDKGENSNFCQQTFEINKIKRRLKEKDLELKKCEQRILEIENRTPKSEADLEFEDIVTINLELDNKIQHLISEKEKLRIEKRN